jgi:beta-xylosidase
MKHLWQCPRHRSLACVRDAFARNRSDMLEQAVTHPVAGQMSATTSTPMKRKDFLHLLTTVTVSAPLASLSCARSTDAPAIAQFQNPLPVAFGDPFLLYDDSRERFYMYGTGGGARDGFAVQSSKDLVSWQHEGQVYQGNTDDSWGIASFWAPEVYARDGRFWMFYSAQWRDNPTKELENFRIGIAVADEPTGPFRDIQNAPLFDPGYPVIDANVLFDEDGRCYLYYSRCCYKNPVESEIATYAREQGWFDEIEESWVYGVELASDFSRILGDPVLLLRPPLTMDDQQAEWESRSVTSREVNRRWSEGSFTFRQRTTYYMMYSANHFAGENYAVGYATASAPLGPYTKASNNPVLQKNTAQGGDVTGTGHNMVLSSLDGERHYCVYHGRTTKSGNERVVFIDPMEIDGSGRLHVHGPNTEAQPLPRLV